MPIIVTEGFDFCSDRSKPFYSFCPLAVAEFRFRFMCHSGEHSQRGFALLAFNKKVLQ
jgi:hypothetical protein